MYLPYSKDIKRLIVLSSLVITTGLSFNKVMNTSETIIIMGEKIHVSVTPTVTPTTTPKPRVINSKPGVNPEIENYIVEVFKEDSNKAFKLLRGEGKCNGENRGLNPKAVYTNKDGSRDRGIFQINDKYHPSMPDSKAFDYKENIRYSYRMYKNDNKTFRRWSQGKCMGI